MRGASPSRIRRLVASIPSTPGMRMSISTTSGRSSRASATASSPSSASPTTSRSSCTSRIARKPARTSVWSSATRTRITPSWREAARAQRTRPRLRSRSRACRRRAVPVRASRGSRGRRRPVRTSSTVVDYLELDVVAAVANGHPRMGGPCVLERVGQRLLHDPVGGEVDAGGEPSRLALDRELYGQADAAHLLDQRVELREAGLRPECGFGVGAAQQAEHATKLAERLAPRARDRDESLARTVGIVLQQRLARLGLYHHRADAVRHDVVQLTRQPGALVGDRRALSCLLLACERSDQEVLAAHDPSRTPGAADQDPGEGGISDAPGEAKRERPREPHDRRAPFRVRGDRVRGDESRRHARDPVGRCAQELLQRCRSEDDEHRGQRPPAAQRERQGHRQRRWDEHFLVALDPPGKHSGRTSTLEANELALR